MVIGWSLLMGEKEHPASSSEQKKETAKTILIFCDLIENPPVYFPTWSQQQKHGPRDGTAKQSPSGSTGILYRTLLCGPVPLSNFSPLLNLAPWRLLIQLRVYAIIKSSWGPLCSSLAAQTERSFCFPMISNKKPGSPSLISGLGRTYAPFGHACIYTLQDFRVFVPPNSP